MSESDRSPLIIGGVGGSGTRVFRAIAEAAGYKMLTAPWIVERIWKKHHDNLLMMKLFYPRWLEAYLLGEPVEAKMKRACRRLLWMSDPSSFEQGRWGWKNPNTLFLIPFWKKLYPNMIYINVIRDGRDIAFNRRMTYINRYNRSLFSEQERSLPDHIRKAIFWKRCNQLVQTDILAEDRRLITPFESLCLNTEPEVRKIFEFLRVTPSDELVHETCRLVQIPASFGRWKNEEPSMVREVEEALGSSLLEFGYETSQ